MTGFFQGPDQAEREAELIRLVEVERLSFADIARIMGAPTRNTVLGRYNRMRKKGACGSDNPPVQNKPKRNKPVVYHGTVHAERTADGSRYAKRDSTVEPAVTETGDPITILEMDFKKMCNYPYGDPSDAGFRYCGHTVREKSPYCEAHHIICRVRPTPYRRKVEHAGKQR